MRVGTGRAALVFPDGLGLWGFGTGGGRGLNVPLGSRDHDTLEARALYIEDGGTRLLVITLDLVGGSQVIEREVRAALGMNEGEVCIVGTHTHSGPGHYFGTFYDVLGSWPGFHRKSVVREIVTKAVQAAQQALANVQTCTVGYAERTVWRAGRNRSLRPFLANFGGDPTRWTLAQTAPTDLTPEEKAIDPRLRVLAFVSGGNIVATWATFCCHAASNHRAPLRAYHRDWPGVAVDIAQSNGAGFAIVHQAANGDVTPLPSGARRIPDGIARIRELGKAIGDAWVFAMNDAKNAAQSSRFDVGFGWLDPKSEKLPRFEIGEAVIAGSEEFDPGLVTKMLGEARTFPRSGDQAPKMPALGPLQFALRPIPLLRPSKRYPFWLVRLGSHVLFASPFEQTTYAAFETETVLVQQFKVRKNETVTASPIGLAGDYAGYVTTPEEYELQNYEGGHTLYGRNQLLAMRKIWLGLI